jgi:hypothetical protein
MLSRATSTSGLPGCRRLERFTVGLHLGGKVCASAPRACPGTNQAQPDFVANATKHVELRRFRAFERVTGVIGTGVPESEVKRDPSVRLAELAGSDQAFNEILNFILWNSL